MPAVERSIEIRGGVEEVFDLAQDYGLRLRWDPFLKDLRFLDGATVPAVGVRTWVRARNGLTMTVEYVAFDRPRTVAMRMPRPSGPFETFGGSWRFKPLPAGLTDATFRYTFRTRPRFMAWLFEPLVGRVLGRDVEARLRGLKHGIEDHGLRAVTPSVQREP
jgi:ribosome-associated toxin RatA of RatAB toxin-antitoxin module